MRRSNSDANKVCRFPSSKCPAMSWNLHRQDVAMATFTSARSGLISPRALLLPVPVSTFKPRWLPRSDRSWCLSSPCRLRSERIGLLGTSREVCFCGVCERKSTVSASVTMAALPGLFPHPASTALYVMEFFLVANGPVQAYGEANGKNMNYSKFARVDGKQAMISSKAGMFLFYLPAALLAGVFLVYRVDLVPLALISESFGASGAASFLEKSLAASDDRLLLVAAALFIHFLKRVLEVLFVHQFSGSTGVGDTAIVATSYASQVGFLLYSQLLSAGFEAPSPDLKWLGVALFLIGITGNAYHHWMLSLLRKDGNKKYVVPRGGLFDLLVCPHYVFEMIDFAGIALISQTLFGWCMAWFTVFYLIGRTIHTKQWYMKKVEGFPEDRSVLIPGIF